LSDHARTGRHYPQQRRVQHRTPPRDRQDAAGDPDAAAALMDRHVAATHEHWAREVAAERETEEVSA
jgi:hypothetical protein